VAGMDAAGRPLDETHVHRPEQVSAITGASIGVLVTPELIAAVLAHPDGGRKNVPPGAHWVPLLNKADTPDRRAAAETAALALVSQAARVVIANLKGVPPVVQIIEGQPGG
jgi:probable selenium-dependent hydroxylase accessory protein YqeC